MSKFLDASAILAADDFEYEEVDVPEWGGKIRLKPLSAKDAEDFDRQVSKKNGDNNLLSRILATHAVDETGKPLFTMSQLTELSKKNLIVIKRLVRICQKISALNIHEVKEIEGN